jgi:AAA family ATP:ADP antiporter
VNVITILIQAFVVSRVVKYLGMRGVMLALPLIALSAYGMVALGAGYAILRWVKTAENATDYSLMNTGRALLWLPTSRDEKFKAKQTIDTFIVRSGDLVSTGVVYAGTEWLALSRGQFAGANVVFAIAWIAVGVLIVREYRELAAEKGIDVRAAAAKK